jgi:VanZ family protein
MLMYATLWPFNPFPPNGVSWLPDASGVRFQHSGVIYSDGQLKSPATQPAGDACAIEIYLRPIAPRDDAGNFLTFSSDDNPDAVFLRQWRDVLLVDRARPLHVSGPRFTEFDVDHALRAGHPTLVTVSSGPQGTAVYIDGKLAGGAGHFQIPRSELYRQIVLGNSASDFQVWHGELYGLAVYDGEISPSDAAAHFATWSAGSAAPSNAADASHVIARYDFRGRSGNTVSSEVASAPLLIIPAHFSISHKALLASPIDEFEWTASWRKDVIENILGFMPFGFVLCGLFALSRPRGQAILMATLVGGLLSLSVESLQYYIPRRDSSLTDVMTNTTGTLLGALIAHPALVRTALRIAFLIPWKRKSEAN